MPLLNEKELYLKPSDYLQAGRCPVSLHSKIMGYPLLRMAANYKLPQKYNWLVAYFIKIYMKVFMILKKIKQNFLRFFCQLK